MEVYINDIAAFLPNDPVTNDEIETVLGMVHNIPSQIKNKILKNNGIEKRYYSIDRKTGELNYTNAQLTAEAIRRLKPYDGFSVNDIQCLCCATSMADVILPGHGLMVQGELGIPSCEVITTSGICLCGITSLKAAYANVALGISENAISTGSELASSLLRSNFFEHVKGNPDLDNQPIIAFESEFLRWMLSDAAGAVFMSGKKNQKGKSLRLDWIENVSYAGQMEVCMYAGAHKREDGTLIGWRQLSSLEEALAGNYFALKQDTRILNKEVVRVTVNLGLTRTMEKRKIKADEIDWFLPHYSSDFFRGKIYKAMEEIGFKIPYEKWFTNLAYKGNTGSASIYVIMEELFHSDRLKEGQKILCFVPESGRFSVAYVLLTVV
ncbi:3-oxoacyl-[acyl-carrier-protein] synthase III [Smithella sp. ME-1]|uniref:3-oxoacyl-acp synthase iii n=1 Tax=hydrocarbon metagenome TaxID=938273 RepID=A0A0W8FQ38_9ZZZZ|nr:3-oxoacyl-[acyl-carrier-protein] synthase III [Smithella sp. ME-1]